MNLPDTRETTLMPPPSIPIGGTVEPLPDWRWKNGRPTEESLFAFGGWICRNRPDLVAISEIENLNQGQRSIAIVCTLLRELETLHDMLAVVALPEARHPSPEHQ